MERKAVVRTARSGELRTPGSPPAIWAAFEAQAAWKSWAIAGLLGVVGLLGFAVVRLASRPPEYVLVDAAGNATPIRRSVATDALLAFLADRSRPPEAVIVRFTRDFLRLSLGVNSSTIEWAWPAALSMMSEDLRRRVGAEAADKRLVETYRLAERATELAFEEIVLEDRTPSMLAVRAVVARRIRPLVDGAGPSTSDRLQVELVQRTVPVTMERPDGLEVAEWRLTTLPPGASTPPGSEGAKESSRAP
jgi:hypothetical protein